MKPAQAQRYNWNDVAYFLEVARHKSLVRAAERLKVDHTTVSRRIRELERSLNTTLFSRTRTGVNLTEAGQRLMRHAEGMESHADSIAVDIGQAGATASGPVRIATMEGIGSLYLARAARALNEVFPDIQLELVTDSRLLDLSRREADLFVSFFRPAGRRLAVHKAGEFKVALYAAPAYLAARAPPASPRALEDHDFIDFIDELITVNENRWLSDILRPARVVFRSTSLVAQYSAAVDGLGIAMLPSFVAAHGPDLVPVLPQLFTIRDIWISAYEDQLHVARIRAVRGFLEQRISRDRAFLMASTTVE